MCGIVGFTGKRNAAPILLDGLSRLEYRGYDSAGIAVLYGGKFSVSKTTGRVKTISEKTDGGNAVLGRTGIGHTRWATHGAPSDTNAHPHLSSDGKIALVHNGIIENYIPLRQELEAKGVKFKSETDTEIVSQLIAVYYKEQHDFPGAVRAAVSRLRGTYAFGILCSDCPDTLIAVRRSSPLIIGVGKGENFIASDVTALVSYTRKVIYLEDGDMAVITPSKVNVYSENGEPLERPVTRITWDIEVAEKDGYDHFMMKEMMEQPKAAELTIMSRIKNGDIVLDEADLTKERLAGFDRIVITACGSASYAGQAARYMIEKLLRIPVEVDLASELRYRDPVVNEKTLLIVISQSGETADTIAAMKECKKRGAYVLSIVNVVGSTIAKLSDDVLYTRAGPEIAVATTKGYTTQLAVLYLFAVYAAKMLGKIADEEYKKYISELCGLPKIMQAAIDGNKNIPELAKKYHRHRSLFFIGRNVDYAVAMEGSLKLKEISYLHSEAYAAGELKHGTISLIDDGHLVIALACYEPLFEKTMSNIKEVRARGAVVLGVAPEGNRHIFTEADDVLFVPKVDPLFLASVEVIPLQFYAYYVAKENGCDIDKPRNLAKSVTVE